MKIVGLMCVLILSGCSSQPIAYFSTYDENVAWDAALLLDMDCSVFIDSATCYNKRNAALEIIKNYFSTNLELYRDKLQCMLDDEQTSEKFLDFVEDEGLQSQNTYSALGQWSEQYVCEAK